MTPINKFRKYIYCLHTYSCKNSKKLARHTPTPSPQQKGFFSKDPSPHPSGNPNLSSYFPHHPCSVFPPLYGVCVWWGAGRGGVKMDHLYIIFVEFHIDRKLQVISDVIYTKIVYHTSL